MDMLTNLTTILMIAGVLLVALVTIGIIFARLYTRSSKEVAFVRTGFGGQKVIMNGGALVLPVLHETIPVNMNTLRLEVKRANEQALITRDRMRVDVQAEFYVRVKPTLESIADAAQTLGQRTMQPASLKELVEGKFVDALRAVAAEMTMTELHEQRVDFVLKVQQAVSEDLLKNGMELESVSLTGMDQTSREYFNPDNAFDAEGLTRLIEEIESRRKRRNDIEQSTEIEIRRVNLTAEQQKLELSRDEQYARLEQEREVAIRRSAQSAEIAREQAERKRDAEQAEISTRQQVDQARIGAERAVAEERIEMERQLKEREIIKAKAIEAAEIERQKALETAQLEKRRALELAEQERAITVAGKSREQSEAEALAAEARSQAVKAEEQVITVREVERAERTKRIELLEAARQAEQEAIAVTTAADAEKRAAEDRAESVRTLAQAEADKQRIAASAAAEAEMVNAEAAAKRYAVEAEGKRAIHEADNVLSKDQIAMQIRLATINNLPAIIRESVRPMERIDGIKIIQVDGLAAANTGGAGRGDGNLADQVVNSALRYRAQAPLLEGLLKEVGLTARDVNGLTGILGKEAMSSSSADQNAEQPRAE